MNNRAINFANDAIGLALCGMAAGIAIWGGFWSFVAIFIMDFAPLGCWAAVAIIPEWILGLLTISRAGTAARNILYNIAHKGSAYRRFEPDVYIR